MFEGRDSSRTGPRLGIVPDLLISADCKHTDKSGALFCLLWRL
jgi:hypothetical protein